MFLCTSRIFYVLPMMCGCLACYELLLVSQVGITVCGWNKILRIYGYRRIGGEALLIVFSYLGWLLPVLIVFPIVAYESLFLRWTVPLWSGFWRLVSQSPHCLIYDFLGALPDIRCSWKSLSYLKLYMPNYPWNGNLGWFRVFLRLQLSLWRILSLTCYFYSS